MCSSEFYIVVSQYRSIDSDIQMLFFVIDISVYIYRTGYLQWYVNKLLYGMKILYVRIDIIVVIYFSLFWKSWGRWEMMRYYVGNRIWKGFEV